MPKTFLYLLLIAATCTFILPSPTWAGTQSRLVDLARKKSTTENAKGEQEKGTLDNEEAETKESSNSASEKKQYPATTIDLKLKEQLDNINDPELYILGANDQIEVSFFEEKELNATKTIDEAGNVRLDLIGSVKLDGLSVIAAQNLIRDKYKADYLQDPRITVSIVQRAKKRFVILGQVRSPGYYEVPRSIRLNIFQAMALAGGYTRLAGRVIIKRTTSRGEVIQKFRLKRLEKKPQNEIPIVAEDDTIIVGETYF